MNCDDARNRLTDHHLDALDPEEAVAVAEHLGTCGECAQAYCRLQAQMRGIGVAYAERPSARMREALRAEVQAAFVPAPSRGILAFLRRPVPVYGVGLAAALPLVAWLLLGSPEVRDTDTKTQPPAPTRVHDYDATVPLLDPSVS